MLPSFAKEDIADSGVAITGYTVRPALGGDAALERLRGPRDRAGVGADTVLTTDGIGLTVQSLKYMWVQMRASSTRKIRMNSKAPRGCSSTSSESAFVSSSAALLLRTAGRLHRSRAGFPTKGSASAISLAPGASLPAGRLTPVGRSPGTAAGAGRGISVCQPPPRAR